MVYSALSSVIRQDCCGRVGVRGPGGTFVIGVAVVVAAAAAAALLVEGRPAYGGDVAFVVDVDGQLCCAAAAVSASGVVDRPLSRVIVGFDREHVVVSSVYFAFEPEIYTI